MASISKNIITIKKILSQSKKYYNPKNILGQGKEGRKERRNEGTKEGRKEERNEGTKERRKEGRKEGRKDARL